MGVLRDESVPYKTWPDVASYMPTIDGHQQYLLTYGHMPSDMQMPASTQHPVHIISIIRHPSRFLDAPTQTSIHASGNPFLSCLCLSSTSSIWKVSKQMEGEKCHWGSSWALSFTCQISSTCIEPFHWQGITTISCGI